MPRLTPWQRRNEGRGEHGESGPEGVLATRCPEEARGDNATHHETHHHPNDDSERGESAPTRGTSAHDGAAGDRRSDRSADPAKGRLTSTVVRRVFALEHRQHTIAIGVQIGYRYAARATDVGVGPARIAA